MKLYYKKIYNIEDLRREKKVLLKELKRMDKKDILSFKGSSGKKRKEERKETEVFQIADYFPGAHPLVGILIKIIQNRLLKGRAANSTLQQAHPVATLKQKGVKMLRTALVEVAVGYIKWKAIELTYKGVRALIRKRKERNSLRQPVVVVSRVERY